MAKVVYAKLNTDKNPGAGVSSKTVRDTDGRISTVHTVNADSSTFGADLSHAFRLNVRKARQDNKKATGASDRGPAKR